MNVQQLLESSNQYKVVMEDAKRLSTKWAKWEKQTGNIIGQASEKLGIWDLMFLAYHAHKREVAGSKPIICDIGRCQSID